MASVKRYMQVIHYCLSLIEQGKLDDGDRMPTEEEICQLFGVSRITVRRAYDELVNTGRIYRVQGKGSFVSRRKTDMQLNRIQGFSEEMRGKGVVPSSELISTQAMSPSPEIAKRLRLEEQSQVIHIVRVRCADGVPMSKEEVFLPLFRFPELLAFDLSGSLYEILEAHYGCRPAQIEQTIEAYVIERSDALLLRITPGSPALYIERTTYDKSGTPIEACLSVYRADKYKFSVTIRE